MGNKWKRVQFDVKPSVSVWVDLIDQHENQISFRLLQPYPDFVPSVGMNVRWDATVYRITSITGGLIQAQAMVDESSRKEYLG